MVNATQLVIHTDGGSRGNPGPAALGVWVGTPSGDELHSFHQFLGTGTNNEAEYEGILASLTWLLSSPLLASATDITWKLDSMLVVEQLNRRWKIKEPRIQTKAQRCWDLLATLTVPYSIVYVPRAENKQADALVNQALDEQQLKQQTA